MKRIVSIIILSTLFWTGCENREGSPGITDTEILIGNIQDLSGPIKELGLLIPAGSNMYLDYINEQGEIGRAHV